MAAAKRKSIAKLCLSLGLFVLAGFFRQADRVGAPLPSAAFFLLTNLIYIGLAMGWGFSISRRILHRCDRHWLLLGCAMAVLWLFLRTVKYRFFNGDTVTRYLWYLYYVPQILAPLFSLFAGLKLPNLTWTNEITPIKQGGSVMLALFGGFVYAGLLPLAYFLGASALGLSACLGIYLGLTLALSAVLYVWLRRRGAAVFAAL